MSAIISSIATLLSAAILALLPIVGLSELILLASAKGASCGPPRTLSRHDATFGRGSHASISRPRERRRPLMRVSPSIK